LKRRLLFAAQGLGVGIQGFLVFGIEVSCVVCCSEEEKIEGHRVQEKNRRP